MPKRDDAELTTRYADMFSAMGTEPRLRIVRLLLSAHPEGLVGGDSGSELEIPSSTLSHHLEKLKNEDSLRYAAREHSSGTRPIPWPFRSCSAFSMRSAALEIRQLSRKRSSAASRRGAKTKNEHPLSLYG